MIARVAILPNLLPPAVFRDVSERLFALRYYLADYGGVGSNWEAWMPKDIYSLFHTREIRSAIGRQLGYRPSYMSACVPRRWSVAMRARGDRLDDHEDDEERIIAVVYYAHPWWDYRWGGELTLIDDGLSIPPMPNTLVAFKTRPRITHRMESIRSPHARRCSVTGWLAPPLPETNGSLRRAMPSSDNVTILEAARAAAGGASVTCGIVWPALAGMAGIL